jgi:hypothetical protein
MARHHLLDINRDSGGLHDIFDNIGGYLSGSDLRNLGTAYPHLKPSALWNETRFNNCLLADPYCVREDTGPECKRFCSSIVTSPFARHMLKLVEPHINAKIISLQAAVVPLSRDMIWIATIHWTVYRTGAFEPGGTPMYRIIIRANKFSGNLYFVVWGTDELHTWHMLRGFNFDMRRTNENIHSLDSSGNVLTFYPWLLEEYKVRATAIGKDAEYNLKLLDRIFTEIYEKQQVDGPDYQHIIEFKSLGGLAVATVSQYLQMQEIKLVFVGDGTDEWEEYGNGNEDLSDYSTSDDDE